MRRAEPFGKAKNILQAAILRKQGKTLEAIAASIGHLKSTVYRWLSRLKLEGLERRYDKKIPGRPSRLTQEQMKTVGEDKQTAKGEWLSAVTGQQRCLPSIYATNFTSNLVVVRHRLAHNLGFSVRNPIRTIQLCHTGGRRSLSRI